MKLEDRSCADWKEHLESLELTSVIANEHAFKARLAIGEDAYKSLRLRNTLADIWEVGGAGATGAAVAGSSAVAATFFPSGGILGLIGLGTAATPIGWVVAAAVVSGTAWLFIRKAVLKKSSDLVEVIPKFINTPIDVLGLALLDLMIPLALKIAAVDGELHREERKKIKHHFVKEWGYDQEVVCFAMRFVEDDLKNFDVKKLARSLAQYASDNPDCKYKPMIETIMSFLRELSEADGRVHDSEKLALDAVERIFKQQAKGSLGVIA